ncbi:prephenate dehydrogenase (NADP(+)) [Puccinia graminis f. sp. tritici]|uniref:Prephenate dehydrogenase (NADP(+)) n=1 Tax=Puccinia graminis f. sp. tritici TaxID=56615 RepID=A0A5B0RNH1_PUCGR|nr:prephenate dehydrogenase (NADP(+)) [Puccinia graminis f. sp. tritici]KAA1126333.1 prephenate dehydrogenase (NADP(+)) [Puccinia graminis f. sp. tritici]
MSLGRHRSHRCFCQKKSSRVPRSASPAQVLSEKVFSSFAIGEPDAGPSPLNSHLTLLAIADRWHQLALNPFLHLEIAATPALVRPDPSSLPFPRKTR